MTVGMYRYMDISGIEWGGVVWEADPLLLVFQGLIDVRSVLYGCSVKTKQPR